MQIYFSNIIYGKVNLNDYYKVFSTVYTILVLLLYKVLVLYFHTAIEVFFRYYVIFDQIFLT